MSNKEERRKLNELPENWEELNIYDLWWDERNKVGMMNDKHIANALLKLKRFDGYEDAYFSQLRNNWRTILRREQLRREELRKAEFTKN